MNRILPLILIMCSGCFVGLARFREHPHQVLSLTIALSLSIGFAFLLAGRYCKPPAVSALSLLAGLPLMVVGYFLKLDALMLEAMGVSIAAALGILLVVLSIKLKSETVPSVRLERT